MPTVLRHSGYRFHFYSHEPNEPPHVHVEKEGKEAKFWLNPVSLADNDGFAAHEIERFCSSSGSIWIIFSGVTANSMAYEPIIIAKKVSVKSRVVHLSLADGSTHSFPVAYYPRLAAASEAALKKVKLRLGGKALRWDNLDEDIWVGHAVIGRYPVPARQLAAA